MGQFADKITKKENRSIADSFPRKTNVNTAALRAPNNRPVAQRKMQQLAKDSVQKSQSASPVAQLMSDTEISDIKKWIAGDGRDYLRGTKPGRVDDAPLSDAVRLRWFDVSIGEHVYRTVGLNIHYGGDVIGGVWLVNSKTNETMEFHPHRDPQHGFDSSFAKELANHVTNEDMRRKL